MRYRLLLSSIWGALAPLHLATASPTDQGRLRPQKRVAPDTHVVHERQMPHWSQTWQKRSKVEGSALLPMRIGLRQINIQQGHELLMERSNPSSRGFGVRMTAREIIDFFAPPKESVDAVMEWLVSGGISANRISQSANKQVGMDALLCVNSTRPPGS